MKTIDFRCDQCVLAISGEPAKIAEYSTEYVELRFDFCEDWKSMAFVAAMFSSVKYPNVEPKKVLVEDGKCKVPPECLRFPGFTFSLWGTNGAGVHSTTNLVQVPVMMNNMRGAYPQPSTPDMFDAILSAANAALEASEEVVRRADSGEFDGKDFYYWKTYPSIADMNLDSENIPDGEFVNINTSNPEIPDDSKVFYKKGGELVFTADHSGKQGIQGEKGGSVSIKGRFDTYEQLIEVRPTGEEGDAYLVGAELYVWVENDQAWVNMGDFKGPQGEPGPGVPAGGSDGQALVKDGDVDYDAKWGVLGLEGGGTGGSTAEQARNNIGAASSDHTHTAEEVGAAAEGHDHDGVYQPAGEYAPAAHKHKAADVTDLKAWLLGNVFKIGFVWTSYTSTSPASIVGGTWTAITGAFPYFNAGTATGGSNTHTLTATQMPKHTHTLVPGFGYGSGGSNGDKVIYGTASNLGRSEWRTTESTGGGGSHNNMPAYQTLYAWRRTA